MTKDRLPFRFDRNEFAGAFGDVGTAIPLILLLIPACGLDARSVLILFGACQIFSALAYRLPVRRQFLRVHQDIPGLSACGAAGVRGDRTDAFAG
jgi:hypothetical protein